MTQYRETLVFVGTEPQKLRYPIASVDGIQVTGPAEGGTLPYEAGIDYVVDAAAGKSHESLLFNNLNHPNDYGHGLYASALALLLR